MYWKREVLKTRAKDVLSRSYWYTFVVCLLAVIAGSALLTHVNFSQNDFNLAGNNFSPFYDSYSSSSSVFRAIFGSFIIGIFPIVLLVKSAFTVFISNPIKIGKCRYLYYNAKSPTQITAVFSGFQRNYLKSVLTLFVRDVIIVAGYIMFIIPGVILTYALRMVPFILAENPNIKTARALTLSIDMSKGQKFDMFVLDLSFLGWQLLGIMALGIGVLFVIPYIESTQAELYGALRRKAALTNACTADEIGREYFQ